MAVTYKDINQLSQKSAVAGTEKIPVSDIEYITPSQIAGLSPMKVYEIHPTTFDYTGIYNALPARFYFTVLDEVENGLIPIIRVIIPDNGGVLDMQFIAYFDYEQTLSFSGTTSKQEFNFQIGNSAGFWTNKLQKELVSGTNIKTINNQSLLGSGNITIPGGGGGGDTSDCVHITGDETVGGDKTFTDNIAVVDASHILYSGASPSQGFTRGVASNRNSSAANSITFTGLSGEPKAFVLSAYEQGGGVLMVVGDSTGCHGIYNTGSQHNYSASFTKSYSNGVLTVTAPTGVTFIADSTYNLIYYYGDGTLTFKTSQVQPGSGVTAVTFTGNGLTEVPAMYACFLESAVNNEQYRRVAAYTNSAWDNEEGVAWPEGITFVTGGPEYTTSSFSVSYNNGLVINSGGTNAGGYFHNPGTYTLYYLMASDIGGGGSGSYSNLADELAAINTTIGDIATILASI